MKRLLLFILSLSLMIPFFVSAQTPETPALEEDQTMLYNYEAHGGFVLHSGSWGLVYRKGKHVTGYKKKFYEIEFAHMRHPKEIKLTNPYYENSKPFAFGKLNSLLIFRGGVGMQHALFGRNQHSGVEIRYLFAAGVSAGLTKPIYLEILKQGIPPELNDVVIERYNPDVHQLQYILGRAAFTYGFDKMSLYPGGYAKFALSFEYGSGSTDVKTIEAGVVADFYGKKIPLMAYIENKNYFLNLYVALTWGGKW
ncbi:MAG TPA: hypothetical protein VI757_05245 [Bacteroidia bacterium]|nr:hypothetical protein [Bacteroidia bacterium]